MPTICEFSRSNFGLAGYPEIDKDAGSGVVPVTSDTRPMVMQVNSFDFGWGEVVRNSDTS